MPSLGDSVFIFVLALMLFGPKKLPQLARQLGKLMAEFRKASNEFRMQMEDELRIEEQKEHQKKVEALAPPPSTVSATETYAAGEASANAAGPTAFPASSEFSTPPPVSGVSADANVPHPEEAASDGMMADATANSEPEPIAESGDLKMMPPSTGLPVESSARRSPFREPEPLPIVEERSIGGFTTVGTSSENPREASTPTSAHAEAAEDRGEGSSQEAVPDRTQPTMMGEGERTTHA